MNLLINLTDLNFVAVFVAGICHMAVGLLWFQRVLFGARWSELTGRELKPATQWLLPGFFGHMLIALALAVFIVGANCTIVGSLLIAVFVWLCFVVTLELGELIWEKIPVPLFLIRVGNHLVALSVASLIIAVWK
jgi:hypothetical protein